MIKRFVSCTIALLMALPVSAAPGLFSTDLRFDPERPRGYILPPLASFVLPSADQWFERQRGAGAVYLSVAGTGLVLMESAQVNSGGDLEGMSDRQKQYEYGGQLYMFAGEMSAFHSFRTAVKSRKQNGEFDFLKVDEEPNDLLLAPFEFRHLLKPTVFVPLAVFAGVAIAASQKDSRYLTLSDVAFTSGVSYNAGVGEEAIFRGYMMPVLRQTVANDFWSNSMTAAAFGAAHYSDGNELPWFQAVAGWYLGWLTQKNGWSLKESIFLHAWWDVLALGIAVSDHSKDTVIPLPRLQFEF